jgi:hypothetical protein
MPTLGPPLKKVNIAHRAHFLGGSVRVNSTP